MAIINGDAFEAYSNFYNSESVRTQRALHREGLTSGTQAVSRMRNEYREALSNSGSSGNQTKALINDYCERVHGRPYRY